MKKAHFWGKCIFFNLKTFLYEKQAQLRFCKLEPGSAFFIRFFSEIKFLSAALLSQASLVVGCMLTSAYDFYAKFQLPTLSRSTLI